MNAARIGAVLAAFGSLGALWVLAPTARSSGHGVLLLTPGATSMQARELIRRHAPRVVLAFPNVEPFEGASRVSSARAAASRLAPDESLIVAGWGLQDEEWRELNGVAVQFEPAAPPEGIVALEAPARVAVGEMGQVAGRVRARGSAAVLWLIGPGGAADSLPVAADTTTAFAFDVHAPASGRFIWRLELRRLGRPVAVDSLGMVAEPGAPLRLLLLERAPSFELNALAGWLGRAGGIVERRTTVSQDREQVSTFNRVARAPGVLDSSAFALVDIVVLHDATLRVLPRVQRAALEREIRDRGLGAVILTDDKLSDAAASLTGAAARALGDGAPRRTRPIIEGKGALEDVEAASVALTGGEVLARDAQGRNLAALYATGVGRVALSTLLGTDAWRRRGADSTYSRWWSALLQVVRRPNATRDDWRINATIRADHRSGITLRTLDTLPLRVLEGPDRVRDTLAFARDPADHVTWYATIWPRSAGWHVISGPFGGRTVWVAEPSDWSALDAERRLTASTAMARTPGRGAASQGVPSGRAALRLLGFVGLVTALGYLWWDDRKRSA